MMVVRVRLCFLRATTDRCLPARATLLVLLFQLASLAPSRRLHQLDRQLRGTAIQLLAAKQPTRTVGKLGTGRNRTREGADAGPYTGEHAAKLALDARFGRRTDKLRLSTLYGLRQR